MRWWSKLVIAGSLLAAGGAGVLYGGVYDTTTLAQHLAPTYWLLETGLRESVKRRARDVVVPPLEDERLALRGLALFQRHCVQCHGAPGVAPEPFALGMAPLPSNLAYTAREWPPSQLYWVVRAGIKMAGMPAFEYRMPDAELWAVVAFLERLPSLSPRDYAALAASPAPPSAVGSVAPASAPATQAPHAGDAARGRVAIGQYACSTCHRIPGIVGPNAPVGPPLEGIARRTLLAGRLANTPENLQRWLREPQQIKPDSAMPPLGVTERDAADIAAYLGAQK
ncbi:MAG: c-type cytochrome [Burkholderiaceae bacterium]